MSQLSQSQRDSHSICVALHSNSLVVEAVGWFGCSLLATATTATRNPIY
jgi:hypothetical protein